MLYETYDVIDGGGDDDDDNDYNLMLKKFYK